MSSEQSQPPTELSWLYRGTEEIFPHRPDSDDKNENLLARLAKSERPLRVKLGIDPTGADLHLGHSIPVRKLRGFQDAGHTAVLIIGDFTAQIGDPTGKSEVRRQLTAAEVKQNAQTYLDQVRSILDFDTPGRLEIRYNSEWLSKLDLAKIQELLSTMTVGQMLAKEGFALRYEQGTPIYLHEFLYPLMQGYDSVAVQSDVELGGTDQKFNIAVGRDLQRYFGQTPQFGMLMPILIGTDGTQKMSKSLNNYVGMSEDPLTMYSKLEKTPDALVRQYFELLTNLPLEHLPENPRECQKLLALDVVSQYHSPEAAQEAQKAAQTLVQGDAKQADAVPEFSLTGVSFPAPLYYLISATGLCKTSSDARRQVQGGAVRLDGDRIDDVNMSYESPTELDGKVLQVGKKKFARLVHRVISVIEDAKTKVIKIIQSLIKQGIDEIYSRPEWQEELRKHIPMPSHEEIEKRSYCNWENQGKPMQEDQAQRDYDYYHAQVQLIAHQIWQLKGSPQQDESAQKADYLLAKKLLPILLSRNAK